MTRYFAFSYILLARYQAYMSERLNLYDENVTAGNAAKLKFSLYQAGYPRLI